MVAVGAHAAGHRVAALRLRRAVLPPRHPDARDQPAHVPLPRPGVRLVEVVEVEDQVPLGGGVEAEVAQVGVTADDRQDAGRGQAREVLGHDRRRTAQEGERRGRHPADPHRHEPCDPAMVGDLHEVDGVEPVGGRLPATQGRARRALPQLVAPARTARRAGWRVGAARRTPRRPWPRGRGAPAGRWSPRAAPRHAISQKRAAGAGVTVRSPPTGRSPAPRAASRRPGAPAPRRRTPRRHPRRSPSPAPRRSRRGWWRDSPRAAWPR